MDNLNRFLKTTTIGGIVVVLPAVVLLVIFRWLFRWATDLLQPLTNLVTAQLPLHEVAADFFVAAVLLFACFLIGLIVRTRAGRFFQENVETYILNIAPGYRVIKETVMQLLGRNKSPFSSVALVRVYESEALMTGFITDEADPDWKTVFVPTGPNPTTGYVLHLPAERVFPVDITVESAIRSIISCGAGSEPILAAYQP